MSKYNYGCANGCEFDTPEQVTDERDYYICPICGTEEFSPNLKETNLEG